MPETKSIGYMISPMGLSEKQLLIYQKLYEKCDFRDMTVKYTISQLSCDIKMANVPEKTIYKNIQQLIKKGYLMVISKASKGNPPIYKIVKFVEIEGEPKRNQGRTKGEPTPSNIKASKEAGENNGRVEGEPKGHPIKEKEKEDSIYSDFVKEFIKIYPGKKVKSVRDKKLPGIIQKYGAEQIKRCVQRYVVYVQAVRTTGANGGKPFQLQFQNESTFWNSSYIDYLDENYEEVEINAKIPRLTEEERQQKLLKMF